MYTPDCNNSMACCIDNLLC